MKVILRNIAEIRCNLALTGTYHIHLTPSLYLECASFYIRKALRWNVLIFRASVFIRRLPWGCL